MDVPSTSRIRPTASNRRLRQRFVTDEAEDAEEVVEEHLEAQEQTEVHKQAERLPLKCLSHAQKISEWARNAEGRQNTVFSGLIGHSGLAPLVATSYHFIYKNMVSAFVER
ncbi:hypothetical protein CKAN_02720500 [Cinnamomum micranthum f. kanehirae]|uniref:Uncharacterized protein n=1 Tax=Cinnamomum micranthum f. kanehirae TaxID=337451 RepID=A0A3S3NSD7_9MAGN|nr:hypothetical protein CKAN_02720500 [Cinnamomum micranthum f. kanehirae]